MGRRIHLFKCLDCEDEYGGDPKVDRESIGEGYKSPPYFFEKMQHMTKSELLDHIWDIECPNCESENWKITDYSVI